MIYFLPRSELIESYQLKWSEIVYLLLWQVLGPVTNSFPLTCGILLSFNSSSISTNLYTDRIVTKCIGTLRKQNVYFQIRTFIER